MNVLRNVFGDVRYLIISSIVSVLVFTFSIWLPNWKLLIKIMPSKIATIPEKVSLLWSLYGSIQTNFTIVSASYTIAIAILFGLNISLFIYYIRSSQGKILSANSTLGLTGLISGFFGVGCAACGTFILSAVLGLVGGAGIIALLPFGGEEFGILGVILLGYSMYSMVKKIKDPKVCNF